MWKNVHPVYRAGIQTHGLKDMSRLPQPLDQGTALMWQIVYLVISNLCHALRGLTYT